MTYGPAALSRNILQLPFKLRHIRFRLKKILLPDILFLYHPSIPPVRR